MHWMPIESYEKPKDLYDYSYPKILIYSKSLGVLIVRCLMIDDDPLTYIFTFDQAAWQVSDITHWMPLPNEP